MAALRADAGAPGFTPDPQPRDCWGQYRERFANRRHAARTDCAGRRARPGQRDGTRRLRLEDFFHGYKQTDLQPHEFIRGTWIPNPAPDEKLFIYKVSKRIDDDISAVLGAFWLKRDGDTIKDCRLAFGGMAATPKRASGAEAALRGQPWNADTVAAAIAALELEFEPMTDVRGSAAYRLQVAGNLLRRAFLESTQDTTTTNQPLMVTDYA